MFETRALGLGQDLGLLSVKVYAVTSRLSFFLLRFLPDSHRFKVRDMFSAYMTCMEQMNFVGGPSQEVPPKVNEVDGLEGQEELCFINNNGTWYRKEPNFQYNNYQQKSYSNNQQGGY
ncbi:hypothetical protein DY000_02021228 [Brassica cretica]|uniref:Uncharacterized protein n=1 Tax=Brassica cretica TaxID=69181 RepID=A0ABQ7ELN6_BRACR|nr:hypothetical protein DY000_02021228 [Brassica cretica]